MSDSQQTEAPKPQQPVSKSVKAAHDQLEEGAQEYNNAVLAGNKELATELRTKLNSLRDKAHAGDHLGSKLVYGDRYVMSIEIHNNTSRWLLNSGGWKVKHGWFESDAVGDIEPGGVCKFYMGGGQFHGLECIAFFHLEGESSNSWFRWWYGPYEPEELIEMWSQAPYSRSLDGANNVGYFYVNE